MSADRGKEPCSSNENPEELADEQGIVQDVLKRALSLGLSSLFSTQETVRKAVGEAMPPEWVDFASDQGSRARQEFIDRLSDQIEGVLEKVDVNEIVDTVMKGRTLEVKASLKILPPKGNNNDTTSYEVSVKPTKKRAPGSIKKKK